MTSLLGQTPLRHGIPGPQTKTPLPARTRQAGSFSVSRPTRPEMAGLIYGVAQRRPLRKLWFWLEARWLCAAVTRPPCSGPASWRGPFYCPVVSCFLQFALRGKAAGPRWSSDVAALALAAPGGHQGSAAADWKCPPEAV